LEFAQVDAPGQAKASAERVVAEEAGNTRISLAKIAKTAKEEEDEFRILDSEFLPWRLGDLGERNFRFRQL
jgi:hypothetical protein